MPLTQKALDLAALYRAAHDIRAGALRGIYRAASGHPGGSLSSADILSYLYFHALNIDPRNPKWEERDRFVLSKGHAAPALYAALSYRGYFPVAELDNLRQLNSFLQGHPDMKGTPGVDMTTGSLGIGLSVACGMALAAKTSRKSYHVYALCGDGELEEGSIWEAAMFATHYKLDNLTLYIDANGLQIDGKTSEVMNIEPIHTRFEAFGWNVVRINGHDFSALHKATEAARATVGQPCAIVCDTVKGRGVSFMEHSANWHGAAPKADEYERAVAELLAALAKNLEGATKQ